MSSPPRILLVEDDDLFRYTLKTSLAKKKWEIVEASSGQIAKQLLENEAIDLVISDLQIPDFSGLHLLGWMRSSNLETPLILMSGRDFEKLDGVDFISKPFAMSELIALIQKHLPC